jgi:hypothetical protein
VSFYADRRYSEVTLDEPCRRASADEPQDDKGRAIAPNVAPDADAELFQKTPTEHVDIEDRRKAEADNDVSKMVGESHRVHAGGGGGNRVRFRTKNGVDVEQIQQMGAKPIGSGSHNARRRAKFPKGLGKLGRPIKGNEATKPVSSRLEPTKVDEVEAWTRRKPVDMFNEMHRLLSKARSGAKADELGAAVLALIVR